jgi:hypothetical protein
MMRLLGLTSDRIDLRRTLTRGRKVLELVKDRGNRLKLLDSSLEIIRGTSMVFERNSDVLEKAHSRHEVT